MEQIAVETTNVVVLAEGSNAQAVANAKGHLFESFVSTLLSTQGYGSPRTENLNVTSEGVELDVAATHSVTGHKLICECKAYSSNVRVPALTSFLGKLALAQADEPLCHGLFVALPRLTPEAKEKADAAQRKLKGFRHFSSYGLCTLLDEAKLLPPLDDGPALTADPMLLVSEHGLALAARELDSKTRRPVRVIVWTRSGTVPEPLIALAERSIAEGLPVAAKGSSGGVLPITLDPPQPIVEVQGSSSDFEYQLPAAPAFFVGRKTVAGQLSKKIREADAASVVVINAKSGWGKSSLSLRLKQDVERAGGIALVVDTRTAEKSDYVASAMERLVQVAVSKRLFSLPEDAAFSSLASVVETIRNVRWRRKGKPLLIVFDQFENVFRNDALTREFRNLALLTNDLDVPLTIGFSWKTDMVGWTEGHPYRLRDEIRDAATVSVLEPFGPREVETLLRRLEKAISAKLHRELRQRLREYSQGLPWLFKKLAGHILSEVERQVSQEELVRESLNVQGLFESDLARLSPSEQSSLRLIAASAPVLVSDLDEEAIPGEVLQSLMHQRLVVQVGHRLDIYWDTFRDFLTTGRVAIEDSYVVRYAPLGAGRLLRAALAEGGEIAVSEAAELLSTSSTVVFNYSRELRLFGVLAPEANRVVVDPQIRASENQEESIRATVAQALRRHKMHTLALELIAHEGGRASVAAFARLLPGQFPTVEAKGDSWFTYARSFCQWLDYAGLVTMERDGFTRVQDEAEPRDIQYLLSGAIPVRVKGAFPGSSPGPALELLKHLSDPSKFRRPSPRRFNSAVRDLSLLGVVEIGPTGAAVLREQDLLKGESFDSDRLRVVIEKQRGMQEAFASLEANPACPPTDLGNALKERHRADWKAPTTKSIGKYIRAWARACGIETQLRRPSKSSHRSSPQIGPTLFESGDADDPSVSGRRFQ